MYNELKNNLLTNNNNNITKYDIFKRPLKKVNLQINADLFPEILDKFEKLPFVESNRNYSNLQNKKNLRKKLSNLENFCHNMYIKSSHNTLNHTKTVGDLLNDSKVKAIENITTDYFENKNIEDNYYYNYNKKKDLNKYKPSSLRKINLKKDNNEDFIFITTNFEIKKRESQNNNYRSIDNYNINRNNRNRYNFGDFENIKNSFYHPTIYILSNRSQNNVSQLPKINKPNNRINIIEEITKEIPDKFKINKEERINQYERYMRARKIKKYKIDFKI